MLEWLDKQPDLTAEDRTSDTSALNRHEVIEVSYFKDTADSLGTTFFVSEFSGSIGIASTESKPTLSVIYPGTDKPPLIFPGKDKYTTALFITMLNQEYLAAATRDNIGLWNLEKNTSSVAFKFNEKGLWRMGVIDDRTIACVVDLPPSDGFSKIYILNMDSEKFTLSGIILLKVGLRIRDMCYVKTTDGTPCLLLNSRNCVIQCVEIVGGKVRWQVEKKQKVGNFFPWSLCTDGSIVFVTDPVQHLLHLLSVEDGTVATSVSLRPFGIDLPTRVRLQGEHLYVGHMNEKFDTYCISKFTKPSIRDSD